MPVRKSCKFFLLSLIMLLASMPLIARGDCPQTTVGVFINYPSQEEFVEFLNERNPDQPAGSWLFQIQEKILAELRMNSPDVVFVPTADRSYAETDYIMTFDISYIGAG